MTLYLILKNNDENSFIGYIVAKDYHEAVKYCEEKNLKDVKPHPLQIVEDPQGNLYKINCASMTREEAMKEFVEVKIIKH